MATQKSGAFTKAFSTLLGVGMIAGSIYWAHREYAALRPWPRTDAVVISSKVMEESGSSHGGAEQYYPLVELKYAVGGKEYTKTTSADSATDSPFRAQREVAGLPPGKHLRVPYNPADPSDVDLGVGWNFSTIGGPALLLLMGLVFALMGLWSVIKPVVGARVAAPFGSKS
jgi:Protein of unknown function (DUF3592)